MSENTKPGGNGFDAEDALASVAASPPADPSTDLRARLMSSRARPGRFGIFADRVARLFDIPLDGANGAIARLESLEKPEAWMPFFVEGTAIIAVDTGPRCASAIATFITVQPGAEFPHHIHRGVETMFVLDGGFVEPATKQETWRGEEITRTEGTDHSLVGLPGTPCIAAVLISGYADFD